MVYSIALNLFLLSSISGMAIYRMNKYYPDGNHVSYDIRFGYLFALAGLVIAVIAICRRKRIFLPILLIITSIALIGLMVVLDYYNILLDYIVWARRGMPEPF